MSIEQEHGLDQRPVAPTRPQLSTDAIAALLDAQPQFHLPPVEDCLKLLGSEQWFGQDVSLEIISTNIRTKSSTTDGRLEVARITLWRASQVLKGSGLALYTVAGFKRYQLDHEYGLGTTLVPASRLPRLMAFAEKNQSDAEIAACRELLQTRVYQRKNSLELRTLFTPEQMTFIFKLIAAYPEPVHNRALAQLLPGYLNEPSDMARVHNLLKQIR